MILILFMNSSLRRFSAFSLIELLVSIVIIMLLVSGSLVGYTRYIDKQRLMAAAEKLESGLREAQSMARIGYLGNCDELAGVQLHTATYGDDGIRYQIRIICAPAGSQDLAYVDLDEDLLIDAPMDITFSPFGYINLTDSIERNLQSTRSSYVATFTIDKGGGIKVIYN